MTDYEQRVDADSLDRLAECETRIGYTFADKKLLSAALTHASGADHRLLSNERLEFLGDSIMGAVVCERLFQTLPTALEGELTRIKSVVVSRQTCAKVTSRLDLTHLMVVGKGMAASRVIPDSVLSDVFEALVAAIYLDGGVEPARDFVLGHMQPEIDAAIDAGHGDNYKSQLQQVAQREFGNTPVYKLMDEKGPDHNKSFKVSARVGSQSYDAAWGRNKKEAEQRAACNALAAIDIELALAREARNKNHSGSPRGLSADTIAENAPVKLPASDVANELLTAEEELPGDEVMDEEDES